MENKRILFTNAEGGVSIVVPAPGATLEQCLKAVPAGVTHEVVDVAVVPSDRTFRDAWFHDTTAAPQKVGVDLVKAIGITHGRRRIKRAQEFAPLDIEATIPAKATAAETARQAIRDKYDVIQIQIDAAANEADLKAIIDREGL